MASFEEDLAYAKDISTVIDAIQDESILRSGKILKYHTFSKTQYYLVNAASTRIFETDPIGSPLQRSIFMKYTNLMGEIESNLVISNDDINGLWIHEGKIFVPPEHNALTEEQHFQNSLIYNDEITRIITAYNYLKSIPMKMPDERKYDISLDTIPTLLKIIKEL